MPPLGEKRTEYKGGPRRPQFLSSPNCRFVLDEHGRKMSKSLGNGIEPLDIINGDGSKKVRYKHG